MRLEIVILAAGKGSRMHSALPKVLHPLAGKALLLHVIECALKLEPAQIHIVVGHQAERVISAVQVADYGDLINWVEQTQQNGTGDAVKQAIGHIQSEANVLIMAGDVPLIEAQTLAPLTQLDEGINLLTASVHDPSHLGRIVRTKEGKVSEIVEHKDASPEQLKINEINTGLMAMPAKALAHWLGQLKSDNAQGELYLTDVIALAAKDNQPINATLTTAVDQIAGVNSRQELARLERAYQVKQAQYWMQRGVSFADPARVDFRGDCKLGEDVWVDVNVILDHALIADNVHIGPHTVIKNSSVGSGCQIEANCIIEGSSVAQDCQLGPYARIRPQSELARGSKIGNFVEVKKSVIGAGSKVNHLSYIGDSFIGQNVNVGAGVITCNYDGANKHITHIGDDAFIGSDSQLVAPVRIGEGATVGAGSTISKDVPPAKLALSRSPQKTIEGWQRPQKQTIKKP